MENEQAIKECIEQIRNASTAIEGIYVRTASKEINELQAFLKIYKENEKIQAALGILKELKL